MPHLADNEKKVDTCLGSEPSTQSHGQTPVLPLDILPRTEQTIPDGGIQAWAAVLGSFLVQMCTMGSMASFGVYQDFYVRHYLTGASPSAISWIGSLNAFLVIAGGIISGKLYDRGYFYALLWSGSVLIVISLFLLSIVQPNKYYQVFLAQGVGAGLGGALCYAPSVVLLAHYFDKRRTLAMSLATIGITIGSVVHPVLLNNLLLIRRIGFGNSVRADAGLQAGLLLIACSLMRSERLIKCEHTRTVKPMEQFKRLCKDGPYIAALFGGALFSISWNFPYFYMQLDSKMHGVNETLTYYSLVIMHLSAIPGGILPGLLGNTLGVVNMIAACAFSCAVVIFGMIGLKDAGGVILISIFYGFLAGNISALLGPVFSTLTSDISELGMRIGIAFFLGGAGGLIGPPIAGALLTKSFIWWRPDVFWSRGSIEQLLLWGRNIPLQTKGKSAVRKRDTI